MLLRILKFQFFCIFNDFVLVTVLIFVWRFLRFLSYWRSFCKEREIFFCLFVCLFVFVCFFVFVCLFRVILLFLSGWKKWNQFYRYNISGSWEILNYNELRQMGWISLSDIWRLKHVRKFQTKNSIVGFLCLYMVFVFN